MIQGLDEVNDSASADTKLFHAGTRQQDETVLTSGGRVLCAVALGEDLSRSQSGAYDLAKKVHWPGSWYRSDIGFKALKTDS